MRRLLFLPAAWIGCAPATEEPPTPECDVHSVSGTVTGLHGASVAISWGGEEGVAVEVPGSFRSDDLPDGAAYEVAVDAPPFTECDVQRGAGVVACADVTDVRVACRNAVPISVDVPAGASDWTGVAPVTFGVPLEAGRVLDTDGFRLRDGAGAPVPGQFEITSRYNGTGEVRWLLVDALADVVDGVPGGLVLELGPDVVSDAPAPPLAASLTEGVATIDTGVRSFEVSASTGPLGALELVDDRGSVHPCGGPDGDLSVELERAGPVRAVVRVAGDFVGEDGATLGRCSARLRFYAGTSRVRVYTTLVWDHDASRSIASLRWAPDGAPAGPVRVGVDGASMAAPEVVRQTGVDSVEDVDGAPVGARLDGWMQAGEGEDALFIGLRWPWQQFPTAFDADPVALQLIGPRTPMSLRPNDVAVDAVEDFANAYWDLTIDDGPYGPLTPRGVGKTHEILVWPGDEVEPVVKNALLQHPVIAFAEPAFSTRADLPSTVGPKDVDAFGAIEAAIEDAFEWAVREDPAEGDYGVWNHGDLQYDWKPINTADQSHHRLDRYWMNHGKGWNVLPWLLFLRSGERRYFEQAEAHSRHLMDVDTCHVTNVSELKFRGGTSGYQPVHFGAHTNPAYFHSDSQYLGVYARLAGYERADDVLQERVEAVTTTFEDEVSVNDVEDLLEALATDYTYGGEHAGDVALAETRFNREHYGTLGDLAVLWEETGDADVRALADRFLDHLVAAQATSGWLPGIKTNLWFTHSLAHVHRALPDRRDEVVELLRRWHEHLGDPLRPSASGQTDGAGAPWAHVILGEATGDPHHLDLAARVARTQALAIHDGATRWRGLQRMQVHQLGPILRDWVVVLGRLAELEPEARPTGLLPAHIGGGLPVDPAGPYAGRSVLFVLDEADEEITVTADMNAHNGGHAFDVRVRVVAPDGGETQTDFSRRNVPAGLNGFPAVAESPFTSDGVGDYRKALELTLAPDGHTGVYAIELLATNVDAPWSATSSAEKLVHYVPGYEARAERITPYALYYDHAQLGSFSSPSLVGAVWFVPDGERDVVLQHVRRVLHATGHSCSPPSLPDCLVPPGDPLFYPLRPVPRDDRPRVTALDDAGEIVCTTTLTGTTTDGLQHPTGEPCAFSPASATLHVAVADNVSWHYRVFLDGVLPFLSQSPEAWFDPRDHVHPDPAQFLVSRD